MVTCKQNSFVLELLQWGFNLASLFSPYFFCFLFFFCSLKDIIAVKSDNRMNPALQRADTLSAAQKVLLAFLGDVL